MARKILITGAGGQIGTELAGALAATTGKDNVLVTDLPAEAPAHLHDYNYKALNVLDAEAIADTLADFAPTEVYHLAALLSGTAEKNPDLAWELNTTSLRRLFDLCAQEGSTVKKVFFPSSIAVFGPMENRENASQKAYLNPTSTYGITKLAGERLCEYYFLKKGLDVRSVRFPGLISHSAPPGGGTTDWAVEIFHAAVEERTFECFLKPDTELPMMYMEDAIQAILTLMEAPKEWIHVRDSYNINGFSLSPQQAVEEFKKQFAQFQVEYKPDFRQAIADSWPASLDDAAARKDWGFAPRYDFRAVMEDMLHHMMVKA